MRQRKDTNRVIIHHSLSPDVSVDTVRKWHLERGWADIGYHFIIHEDGEIENGRYLHLVGSHAKGRNSDSIGVCVMGNFEKYNPTLWQYWALKSLIKSLSIVYCKELATEYHHEKCPAKGFDREFFEEYL